jgi:hypothetical protein
MLLNFVLFAMFVVNAIVFLVERREGKINDKYPSTASVGDRQKAFAR